MKLDQTEKKRVKKLLQYQIILWIFVDLFLIRDLIVKIVPENVFLSWGTAIIAEVAFTTISIYTDIRFSRYLARIKQK